MRLTKQDRLDNAHNLEGSKRFGKRWDNCNFGWAAGDNWITSKVYGSDPQTLTTTRLKNGRYEHSQQPYGSLIG